LFEVEFYSMFSVVIVFGIWSCIVLYLSLSWFEFRGSVYRWESHT